MKSFQTFLGCCLSKKKDEPSSTYPSPSVPDAPVLRSQYAAIGTRRGAVHRHAHTKGRRLRLRRSGKIKKKTKTFRGPFWRHQRRDHPSLSNMALPWTCDREFSFFHSPSSSLSLIRSLFFFCWLLLLLLAERKSRIATIDVRAHTHRRLFFLLSRSPSRPFPSLLFFSFLVEWKLKKKSKSFTNNNSEERERKEGSTSNLLRKIKDKFWLLSNLIGNKFRFIFESGLALINS